MNDKKSAEEIKTLIRNNIKWKMRRPESSGGQSCGHIDPGCLLVSEELDLKIEFGYNRSMIQNKEMAYTLFELVLGDLKF